jgi:outer membrane protein assembly factor BamD (BamD/ComL family)
MIDRRLSLPALFCCAAILTACGSAKYEWSQANSINTVAAYQEFLSKYPNDAHAADAKSRIAGLQDEHAWLTAQAVPSAQAYQQYLTAEPNGGHVQAARDEIATRERSAAWHTAQTNSTAQSMQEFLQQYPTGPEADRARARLKELAGYRAELGTAHTQQLADRERDALAKRLGKIFQQVVVLQPDANNHDYRIVSSAMSEQDVNVACASVKHAGRSCKVIQAEGLTGA